MCGVAGFWSARSSGDPPAAIATAMAAAITHRGPDDAGYWVEPAAGLALAHRRLSIVDLSPLGHQPMVSPSGRYVIVFNGEVYNHRDLRRELESRADTPFRGHSDTEVMLAAIDAYGLDGAVARFVGMFAFALWDRVDRQLHLVRDRLGIKPLYYGQAGSSLVFGSELKALAAHPDFQADVNRGALALLLRSNCIPAPYSIYLGVYKLLPGTILTFQSPTSEGTPRVFWSAAETVRKGVADPFRGTDHEAVDELDRLLREAVRLRMLADVPLGAFLSGGIDSSTVVALMQAQSDRAVKTFAIGSSDPEINEAHFAREVAQHLQTDHVELYVTPQDARDVIPSLPDIYDEPFADSSQIPTYLVSKLARREVTVALSGDGGDELFAGYNRHLWVPNIWNRVGWLPSRIRRHAGRALSGVSPERWNRAFQWVGPVLPKGLQQRASGDKLHKLAGVLSALTPEAMYRGLTSHWAEPERALIEAVEPPAAITDDASDLGLTSATERMLYLDLVTYLPDDILTKVDRASMAVSLEARVPLLDHRVVEFAWRVPISMKLRNGRTKWLLRQVLQRYVPEPLVDRPKSGFGIPVGSWLRGPLRDWAEALLDERRLRHEGFFHPGPVRVNWAEHLSGRRNREARLWGVLMFQAWNEARRSPPCVRAQHAVKTDAVVLAGSGCATGE